LYSATVTVVDVTDALVRFVSAALPPLEPPPPQPARIIVSDAHKKAAAMRGRG
jgi:hypothetical protein